MAASGQKRTLRPRFSFIFLIFMALETVGCATQSTFDRLESEIGSPSAPNNIVGKRGSREQPEFVTGGFVAGAKPYAVAKWKELASTEFRGGKLTLLVPEGEQVRLSSEFASVHSEGDDHWDKIFAARFAAMAEVLGGNAPRVDITFRLVPSGVRYRFAEKQSFKGFDSITLELLAVIPPDGQLDRDWLLTQAITAVHESFHVIRTDPKRFPRQISLAEEEVEAYLVGVCSSVLASNHLPDALFAFPKVLEEAVDPSERDILIRDVYEQALEQKNEPTVVGVSVAMLAFFRYLTELKGAELASPPAYKAYPLCNAAARDELHWAQADIDSQIKRLARQATKLPSASESTFDQQEH